MIPNDGQSAWIPVGLPAVPEATRRQARGTSTQQQESSPGYPGSSASAIPAWAVKNAYQLWHAGVLDDAAVVQRFGLTTLESFGDRLADRQAVEQGGASDVTDEA